MQKLFIEKTLWNGFSKEAQEKLKGCRTIKGAYAIVSNETEDEMLDDEDAVYENIETTMFRTDTGVYFQTPYADKEYVEVGNIERD